MNTALSDCAQCWSTYFRRRLHGWHANLGSILGKGLFLSELKKKMIDLNELKARYPKVYDAIDYWKDNYQSFEHDFSAEQILKEAGFFDMNFNHFYEGVIGAENGTKNATLSSKLVGQFNSQYPTFGLNYSLINMTHVEVMAKAFPRALENLKLPKSITYFRLEWVVKSVKLESDKVIITNQEDVCEIGDYFICATPVNQVQKISWSPPFQKERVEQLEKVRMDKGGKLIIKLDQMVPSNIGIIHLDHKYNLNMWNNSVNDEGVIIAILCEDAYAYAKSCTIEHYAEELIQKINESFDLSLKIEKLDYTDWGEMKYIEGLYSYPVPGTRMDYHRIISEPIDGRIYFIGEYVHPVYTQSMLGACESALQVANLLC